MARCLVCAVVHGAPQISTTGTRCGGLTGWATRQRPRPGRWSVNFEATIAEVDEASTMSFGRRGVEQREGRVLGLDRLGPAFLHVVDAGHRVLERVRHRHARRGGGRIRRPVRTRRGRAASARSARPRSRAATRPDPRRARSSPRARRRWPRNARSVRRRRCPPLPCCVLRYACVPLVCACYSHNTLRRSSRSCDSARDGPMCVTAPRSSATVRSESASARSRW